MPGASVFSSDKSMLNADDDEEDDEDDDDGEDEDEDEDEDEAADEEDDTGDCTANAWSGSGVDVASGHTVFGGHTAHGVLAFVEYRPAAHGTHTPAPTVAL